MTASSLTTLKKKEGKESSVTPSIYKNTQFYGMNETSITPFEAIVLRNYHAEEDDELTVKNGDIINVLNVFEDGWSYCGYEGANQQQYTGLIPTNCYERADRYSSTNKSKVPIKEGSIKMLKETLNINLLVLSPEANLAMKGRASPVMSPKSSNRDSLPDSISFSSSSPPPVPEGKPARHNSANFLTDASNKRKETVSPATNPPPVPDGKPIRYYPSNALTRPNSTGSSNTRNSCTNEENNNSDAKNRPNQKKAPPLPPRRYGKTDKTKELQERRKRIRLEILETERTYVHCLTLLKNSFAKIIKLLKIVPEDVYKSIFPTSLDVIFEINTSFLTYLQRIISSMPSMCFAIQDLQSALSKLEEQQEVDESDAALQQAAKVQKRKSFEIDPLQSQSTQLASLILHYAHTFKLYTDYINKYPIIINALTQEKARNKTLVNFLDSQRKLLQSQGERCCNIEDLFITPIQRLPRYRLLFEDLKKHTEPGHESYQKLEKALELISGIARFCNDKEEEYLSQIAMANIVKRFKLKDFLKPGRRMLLRFEDQTEVQYLKSNNTKSECDFYLFSDLVLLKKGKNGLTKKSVLLILYIKTGAISDVKGAVSAVKLTTDKITIDQQSFHSLQIEISYVNDKEKPDKLTLLCKSEETLERLLEKLNSL
jgi:hypothetical protein